MKDKFNKMYESYTGKKKVLIIARGIPGSGKSYSANKVADATGGTIFSTDDFWFNKEGKYVFNPAKIAQAHGWNQHRAKKAMLEGKTPVIIDNTNTTKREYAPYLQMAKRFDYSVEFLMPDSPWWEEIAPRIKDKTFTDKDVKVFVDKNSHDVPEATIRKMMERFQF